MGQHYFRGGTSVDDPCAIFAAKPMLSPSAGCGWMVMPISITSEPISIPCGCYQCRCAPPELHAAGLVRRACCTFSALSCAVESTCHCGQARTLSFAHAAYLQTGTASACPYTAAGVYEILVKSGYMYRTICSTSY